MTTGMTFEPLAEIARLKNKVLLLEQRLKQPKLIGLIGCAGAGKTTVARIIEKDYGFSRIRFAGGIKSMLRALLFEAGIDPVRIHEMIDGSLKETSCDELSGKSPRYCMQTLGTEWGREFISQNFWVDLTMHAVDNLLSVSESVVIDDVRFPNEVRAIKDAGGKIFRVMRDQDAIPEAGHKSEGQILEFDACILNTGTLSDLENQIAKLI
jgi:hypothetical protein